MRRYLVALVIACVLVGCHTRARNKPNPPPLPAPDLSGYATVPVTEYLVTDQAERYVSFRTPDGLTCRIAWGVACDGVLHGTPAPANEVGLHGKPPPAALEVEPDGFRQTSKPQTGAPTGRRAPMLTARHKIVYNDVQCAVDAGAVTKCSQGAPPVSWFVLSPTRSGIGPRPAGLPPNFPDPHDFVIDEQPYTVGSGARNMFPLFTTASGLTCKIVIFSGGAFGCDGPLPGVAHGENEIYVDLSARQVGIRKTDSPQFTKPMYPGTIRRLPAHYRLDYTYETYTTCLATDDGGVACYGQTPGRFRGFVVSSNSAWTFGG
jgi:hypothetical protein